MLAQKRAKKQAQQHDRKEKRAEKQAKEIQKIQVAQHWQALKMGKINRQAVTAAHLLPCSEEERNEAHAYHMSFLADMWHHQNLSQAFAHAEMRIHLLKIIFELYHDEPDFDFQAANEIFKSAKADLDTFIHAKKRGTPEENRKKLDYFEFWLKLLVFDYGSFVPQAAFRAATSYNTGLQITAYHKQIMTTKPEYVAAAFKVIRGASVESTATKYGLTQHETRQNTLMIGQALYRIGFICDEYNTIKAADTITQLRTPEYQKLADLDELLHMATNARKLHCQPFERKYCLTQVDWQDYDKSVLAGMWAIGELLKPTKHFQAA